MGDIRLFRTRDGLVDELPGHSVSVEKSLQTQLERHLPDFLGVKFLASEFSTGKTHGGRIDTLGIDENGCPVIIEYKRATNQNVINQGLFYLDWLLDHRAEFQLLVMKQVGEEEADRIEWASPRLLCIAGNFTKYDEHAVQQMHRNIELLRYRRYGDDLLLLELINAVTATPDRADSTTHAGSTQFKTASEHLEQADESQRDRYEALKAFLLALGDDVQLSVLKYYFAFKRLRNFACVELRTDGRILVYVKVDAQSVELEDGFTRDVTEIGHLGTGNLEITLTTPEDLARAESVLLQSYEAS